jgi:hypothetical protein
MPSGPEHQAHRPTRLFRRTSPGEQLCTRLRRVGSRHHRPNGGMGRLATPTGPRTYPRKGHG